VTGRARRLVGANPARAASYQRARRPRRRRAATIAAPPVPSSPAPTTAIRAKGHPVIGRPPGLGGPEEPTAAARLGLTVGVAGVVGGTDGDGLADPDGDGLGP
jgi:hypothetical protein